MNAPYGQHPRPPPGKRDFQDHRPARNAQELYERYDATSSLATPIILGIMLTFIIIKVSIKRVVKAVRRRLSKTKLFGKYFPEEEIQWPPLHVAERIAREEGIELSKALILKLTAAEEGKGNLRRMVHDSRSHAWVAAAIFSPLVYSKSPPCDQSVCKVQEKTLVASPRNKRSSLAVAPSLEVEHEKAKRKWQLKRSFSLSKLEMKKICPSENWPLDVRPRVKAVHGVSFKNNWRANENFV